MAKGYWIANVDVTDPEGYKAYVAANAAPLHKYGGRFLAQLAQFEGGFCDFSRGGVSRIKELGGANS